MSGSTQSSLRKTLGALKDTTTVSLAKINSGYKKDLDIAIVKATNHVERPAKERHIKAVFAAISATKPRADVAYCIHALARRLSKTRNWVVALKTLIVIHRALREVDPTFQEEIINYDSSKGHMLSLTQFKDNSSHNAWDYSAWVRCYALFLEERLECFKVLKYDIETDRLRTKDIDTPELLEQLQALLQLLHRVIGCQPQGAAAHNFIVRLALSMVVSESIKIYNAISDGAVNLVDKFFEMQRYDALKALDIYHRAGQQSGRLSEFYENCKELDIGHGERFMKIEQPPASFLQAMEEYVQEAPRGSTACKDLADDKSKTILAIEYKKNPEVKQEHPLSPQPEPEPKPKPKPEPIRVEAPKSEPPQDLLGLNEPAPAATELDEKNALALAIVPVDVTEQPSPTGQIPANGTTGWELALVTALSTIKTAPATSKLDGGLDKLTLDRLYDDALQRNNPNLSYNPWEQPMNNPFYTSNVQPPVQMTGMYNQQQMTMMGPQQPVNPFENTYGSVGHLYPYGPGTPAQAYNPYSGLI